MYTVAVKRDFIAQHYLTGGDWGSENDLHSHYYQVEIQFQGDSLNVHGYLIDIVDIQRVLDALVGRYNDCTLNDLEEFKDLNPSIEHFSRIICQSLAAHIQAENIGAITVKLWENDIAWASYQQRI